MSSILLAGAGPMAVEYTKVLKALGHTPVVVGRGEAAASKFAAETGVTAAVGGLDAWLDKAGVIPQAAIVAVGEKWVGQAAQSLMRRGVRRLLLEKPGGFDAPDIRAVGEMAAREGAQAYVGYNRRFYASVAKARQMIEADGGVTSFNFEFTEWSHVITPLQKEEGVKEQWFLSNSTHVIDLAFHLGGWPADLSAYVAGGLPWHPGASIFAGAGRTQAGALFSYQANWEAPGRFGVEVLTRRHRLIFRPLEKLQVQKIGSVAIEMAEIDDAMDQAYKPGLYAQTRAFLGAGDGLVTISEQLQALEWYLRIRGDAKRS
jgi:predicted dehydrogenase